MIRQGLAVGLLLSIATSSVHAGDECHFTLRLTNNHIVSGGVTPVLGIQDFITIDVDSGDKVENDFLTRGKEREVNGYLNMYQMGIDVPTRSNVKLEITYVVLDTATGTKQKLVHESRQICRSGTQMHVILQ